MHAVLNRQHFVLCVSVGAYVRVVPACKLRHCDIVLCWIDETAYRLVRQSKCLTRPTQKYRLVRQINAQLTPRKITANAHSA